MGTKANLKQGPCAIVAGTTAAVLSTAQGSNKDLTFTALQPGTAGNDITVAYVVSGASTALSVVVTAKAIVVNVKTTGLSAADSTAAEIKAAIEATNAAAALVSVALKSGQDGTGKPGAMAATNLAGGADTDLGYTKGGFKMETTPIIKTFTVDQEGSTPVLRVIDGVTVKAQTVLAEYSMPNLKIAFLNGIPLQDDTDSTKKRLELKSRAGVVVVGRTVVIKPIDPTTGAATTNKQEWITLTNAAPSDATVAIMLNSDDLRTIPLDLECIPDSSGVLAYFGDGTATDSDSSGF